MSTHDLTTHSHQSAYRGDIDGLRALAVLAVLVFHLEPSWLSGGFAGVDIFFVISGFLITGIISREIKAKKFSFINFYSRRILRILPALLVVLFASLILALLILLPKEIKSFGQSLFYASLQISNFLFQRQRDYFDDSISNEVLLHTWSLGVEEQFYLFWPLILLFGYRFMANKLPLLIGVLMLISLAVSEYLVQHYPLIAYYSLLSRMFELAIGGVLALYIHKINPPKFTLSLLGFIGLLAIFYSLFFFNSDTDFPGISALIPCLGAALVMLSGHSRQGLCFKLLSQPLLVFIGKISYSLYLWHWPIIAYYKIYTAQSSLDIFEIIQIVSICFICAYVSYRWVEQPFRKPSSARPQLTKVTQHD